MRIAQTLLALSLAAGSFACGATSDGQIGENGEVRFSLVVDFIDNASIDDDVATHRTLFVAMQHPKRGFLDDETYTKLSLQVRNEDGELVSSVFPLGFAQYGVVFEQAGRYKLVAMDGGTQLDAFSINVRDVDDIALSRRVVVSTTYEDDNGDTCARVQEIDGIENVVLHENQSVQMFVVPRASDGADLIGFLALTGDGPDSVILHSPLVGQGRRANSLIVTPDSTMTPSIRVVIEDADGGHRIDVELPTKNEPFELDCSD